LCVMTFSSAPVSQSSGGRSWGKVPSGVKKKKRRKSTMAEGQVVGQKIGGGGKVGELVSWFHNTESV